MGNKAARERRVGQLSDEELRRRLRKPEGMRPGTASRDQIRRRLGGENLTQERLHREMNQGARPREFGPETAVGPRLWRAPEGVQPGTLKVPEAGYTLVPSLLDRGAPRPDALAGYRFAPRAPVQDTVYVNRDGSTSRGPNTSFADDAPTMWH